MGEKCLLIFCTCTYMYVVFFDAVISLVPMLPLTLAYHAASGTVGQL